MCMHKNEKKIKKMLTVKNAVDTKRLLKRCSYLCE